MNKFDSDTTYCSEVEEFSKAEKNTNHLILRRSQRLSQNSNSKKFDWKNYEVTGKFRRRNGSSQLHLEPVVDGSTFKLQEQCSLKTSPHSRDILEQCQTESFLEKLPLNQKYYISSSVSCNRNSNSDSRIHLKRKIGQDSVLSTLHDACKEVKKDAADIVSSNIRLTALESQVNNNNNCTKDSTATCIIGTSNQISNVRNSKDIELGDASTKRACTERNNKRTKSVQKSQTASVASETINNLMASNDIKNQQSYNQRKKRGRKRKCSNNNKSKVNKTKMENYIKYSDHIEIKQRTITRMPAFQPTQKTPHFDNAIIPPIMNYDTVRQSLLPTIYPPHFQHQVLPTELTANAAPPSLNTTAGLLASTSEPNLFLTPDISQILQHPSPSTAQSSPDSLRDLFDSTEIREILNIEKVTYRLTEPHVQALSIVLNLKFEYLCGVFEKILKLNSNMLQRINEVFKMASTKMDTKTFTDRSVSPSASEIRNSQSPLLQRYFPSQRET